MSLSTRPPFRRGGPQVQGGRENNHPNRSTPPGGKELIVDATGREKWRDKSDGGSQPPKRRDTKPSKGAKQGERNVKVCRKKKVATDTKRGENRQMRPSKEKWGTLDQRVGEEGGLLNNQKKEKKRKTP